MIKNGSSYSMTDIYEYLAGYTTKLKDKISVRTEIGMYYDVVIIQDNS